MGKSVYSKAEVKGLVDRYAELYPTRDTDPAHGLRVLLHLADLHRAFRALPSSEQAEAIFVHGVLRQTVRGAAAGLEDTSATALFERYDAGLSWITDYLNGGA